MQILTLGFNLPHSRKMELEADKIGVYLMSRACYNPKYMISTFRKLQRLHGEGLKYMSTHPSFSDRITRLKKEIPKAQKQRELFCASGMRPKISKWYEGLPEK